MRRHLHPGQRVEDEINGLVTYDRKQVKLTPERMLPVAQALRQAMEESV